MIDYGSGPAPSEAEVVVFGPGFGEAIAVHLGDEHWVLVDSCVEPETKQPASLAYLSSIGVDASKVRAIVASHWHDDHVRGISELAEKCKNAEFHLSSCFNGREAAAFLAAFSGALTAGLSKSVGELYKVILSRQTVWHVGQRSIVLEIKLARGDASRVTAFSPTPAASAHALAHLAQYLPRNPESPIRKVVPLAPNVEAVALHIDLGDSALLLGSDLEEHSSLGWSAVIADGWCREQKRASLYKVAHHGAASAEAPGIWADLLDVHPLAVLTPFNLGKQRIPTPDDRNRIKLRSRSAHISSNATVRPRIESSQLKRLSDVVTGLRPINTGFGAVRARRVSSAWQLECFGDAGPL